MVISSWIWLCHNEVRSLSRSCRGRFIIISDIWISCNHGPVIIQLFPVHGLCFVVVHYGLVQVYFTNVFQGCIASQSEWKNYGLDSLRIYSLIGIGIPIINLRRSLDWLRFIMEIPVPVRRRFSVTTVYPKKYAHGFCFVVLCCGYTLTDFPISIRLTSLALGQSNDCPSASKETLMNMDKYFMWIHYERLHNHNKAKHNKTVCIFLGIYCRCPEECDEKHPLKTDDTASTI